MALSGCVTTPQSLGRVVITEDQSKLVFYDADASQMRKVFYKDKEPSHRNTTYLGIWTDSAGTFPQARIQFTELGPNYHFPKLYTPKLYIEGLNFGEGTPITTQARGSTDNALGFMRYQHFTAGKAACIAFTRTWRKGEIFAQVTSGNVMLIGHYCSHAGFSLSNSRAMEVINNVGVKGEGVPTPSAIWLKLQARKENERTVKIPIEFSWPVFGDNISGHFLRTGQSGVGKIWVAPGDGVECSGTWKYIGSKQGSTNSPLGEWSILCNNGMTAKGTYASADSKNITGAGQDAEGNAISFSFIEPTG